MFAIMHPSTLIILAVVVVLFASPVDAFGAGFVPQGSSAKGTNFRHGDILYSVYFLKHAHATMIRGIYFGNWLRDFSQLMDRKALEVVPEEILRAVVAIFAYIQFGYTTAEFEVTQERLGYYRPEEHIDNPKGYEGGTYTQLRPAINPQELAVDRTTGMKNYIANKAVDSDPETSRDYIDSQLVAAVACARTRDAEAYVHLGAALHALEDFVAHSNWVELCMQMLSSELTGTSSEFKEMANVFPFTGGAATVKTIRGQASPLVTGTFGALDLYVYALSFPFLLTIPRYQTVLGEFDDKLSSMSLPGIQQVCITAKTVTPSDCLHSTSRIPMRSYRLLRRCSSLSSTVSTTTTSPLTSLPSPSQPQKSPQTGASSTRLLSCSGSRCILCFACATRLSDGCMTISLLMLLPTP